MKCRKNSGFTLIEVILSMAILAVISLPLLKYFTESIRYSQLMEKKQQSTVLAQQIVEQLKAEEVLIGEVGADDLGNPVYSVPVLVGPSPEPSASPNPAYYQTVSGSFDSEGRGSMVLMKSDSDYDVVVSLDTDSVANKIERPIVYSIDDTRDVLAIEKDQLNEAVIYFMAINSAYVSEQNAAKPGASPAPGLGLTVMSKAQIVNNMSRKMTITIDKDASSGHYLVKGSYVYTCVDIEGAGSSSSFTGSPIIDVKTAELRSIYLLYDALLEESAAAKRTPKKDELTVENNVPELNFFPNLVVVCQNIDETELSAYEFQIKYHGDESLANTKVRTNLNFTNIKNSYGLSGSTDKVTNLSESGYPVRIINITASVYNAGGYAGGQEPYAVFTSTKGE